ncbi:MAG: hypothetical protein JXR73_17330 [Candidatus Omnitrophica bacterium]|nr:hypothetical protein [Candidatus Omnitrophota bacterium]
MSFDKNTFVPLVILGWLGISVLIFFIQPMNLPLLTIVYPAFFKAIFSIQFRLPDSFFWDLSAEITSLALHGAAGVLFLRLCMRLPAWIEWAAGVFMGIGLANFILELWAIPFLLNRWTVLLSLIALALILYVCKKRWGWAPPEEPAAADPVSDRLQRILFWSAWSILALMAALFFYHALLFPVQYWDALILYIHYGKMIYQQGGFPILHCLQVGLGLGANYPHLYPLHQAATAMMFGYWSDLYGQLLPPLAGLGSMLILYCLGLRLLKNRLSAIYAVLAFCSISLVSTYFILASDYALVMFYTALFLLFLEAFLSQPSIRRVLPLMAVSAIFPHINYLGWIVWPVLVLAIAWSYAFTVKWNKSDAVKIAGWLFFWFGLGLTWYIRNYLVTGNPVYAFFPKIFGGVNINLDVLASCNQEWTAHGIGAAHFGESLWQRIVNSLRFFQADWRFSPLLTGIMLPGLLLGWKRRQPFFGMAAVLFALYFIYQYIVSGLYFYHTLAVFPILGLFVGRFLHQVACPKIMASYCVLLLIAGLAPGLSTVIMGPKMPRPTLPLFAHPGLSPEEFYRIVFRSEAPAWRYINRRLEPDSLILTHDNRYHVYRDDIRIIHLDDCGLTPLYGAPYPEVHQELLKRGVGWYLFIPDEKSHPITVRLGHLDYLDDKNYYELVFSSGNTPESLRLYKLLNPETPWKKRLK